MTERTDRIGLYSEFAKNRQRSSFRRMAPFVANMAVDMPIAIAGFAHDAAIANYLSREYPEPTNAAAVALSVSLGITSIGAFIQYLDITGVNSPNGKLAVEIAQAEGRNPQTKGEIKSEIERVKDTVDAAKRISPDRENLFYIDLGHRLTRFRSRKKPEVVEEKAITDRNFRKWAVKATERTEFGYRQSSQLVTNSLLVADRLWAEVTDNPNQPEYRRRYGLLMRDEIRRKLVEQFEITTAREASEIGRYETMSAQERARTLKALISQFPENNAGRISSEMNLLNEDLDRGRISVQYWHGRYSELNEQSDAISGEMKTRDQSLEKKALFEKLRGLVAYSPTTLGFQEVLLRELDSQYNAGVVKNPDGIPVFSEPLIKLATAADPLGDNSLFDPEQAEDNERKLYAIVSERHKTEWNPFHYSTDAVPNPVLRWARNRKEDTFELIYFTLGKLAPLEPKLERSWKWQYRAKYKKTLKPLN